MGWWVRGSDGGGGVRGPEGGAGKLLVMVSVLEQVRKSFSRTTNNDRQIGTERDRERERASEREREL